MTDVRVATIVRIRPLFSNEDESSSSSSAPSPIVSVAGTKDEQIKLVDPQYLKHPNRDPKKLQEFTRILSFDKCFTDDATNDDVFAECAAPLVKHCLDGYNCALMAYGQTGSGKTHTMMGNFEKKVLGIVQQVVTSLHDALSGQGITTSFMEIYNEKVYDLLTDTDKQAGIPKRVREDKENGAFVENLTCMDIEKVQDINRALELGFKRRAVASTMMNHSSSRSHAIVTVYIKQRDDLKNSIRISKISLVDLAGSERQSATGSSGDRLIEANNINRSLSALGDVINALSKHPPSDSTSSSASSSSSSVEGFIPYRNSTLTWILKDSLGGNCRSALLATISPNADSYNESFSTLRFVERARYIMNRAIVNETQLDVAQKIMALEQEVLRLQQELTLAKQQPSSFANVATSPISSKSQVGNDDIQSIPQCLSSSQDCEEIIRLKGLCTSFESEIKCAEDALDESILDSVWDDNSASVQVNMHSPKLDLGLTPIRTDDDDDDDDDRSNQDFMVEDEHDHSQHFSLFDEVHRLMAENDYLTNELNIKREEIDTLISEYVVPVSEQIGTVELRFKEEVGQNNILLKMLDEKGEEIEKLRKAHDAVSALLKREVDKSTFINKENERLKNVLTSKIDQLEEKDRVIGDLLGNAGNMELGVKASSSSYQFVESSVKQEVMTGVSNPPISSDKRGCEDGSLGELSLGEVYPAQHDADGINPEYLVEPMRLKNMEDEDTSGSHEISQSFFSAMQSEQQDGQGDDDLTCTSNSSMISNLTGGVVELAVFEPLFKKIFMALRDDKDEGMINFDEYIHLKDVSEYLFERLHRLHICSLDMKRKESEMILSAANLDESLASSPSKRFVSYNRISQDLANSKVQFAVVSTEYDALKKEYRTLEKSTCALKLELADLKSKLEGNETTNATDTNIPKGTSRYLSWLRGS